jgi:predicted choloylglycine hydrolase
MTTAARIPFVLAQGSPFEIGEQHGRRRRYALHAFIRDDLTRLNRVLAQPVTIECLRPMIEAYTAEIEAAAPHQIEELRGLAAGADLDWEHTMLLQLRREIMGYQRIPTAGDCTTYARSGPAPFLAQTIDLNGNVDDQLCILDVAPTTTPCRSLVLSFGGLLGYLGVNSHGLAIGLNLVLGGQWRPGLPPYLAIRHLLDSASSVDEALDMLRGMKLASSRSLMFCDTTRSAYAEILDNEIRVSAGSESSHTNHFLAPEFAARDELNVFARNSSLLRLKACRAGLADLGDTATVEDHFALMSTEPVCVHDTGDIRREKTVAAVVMLPASGELHVRPGNPSYTRTQSFTLRQGGKR